MSFSYPVLGLRLRCNRPLPYLATSTAGGREVLEVELGQAPAELASADRKLVYESAWLDEKGLPMSRIWRLSGSGVFCLDYCNGMEFLVDHRGRQVWAEWSEANTFEDVVTYLLASVLGFVLRLHGVITLHASAVVIDGSAVALAGRPGAGKSTTAAAFASRGFPVLTDDITALRPAEDDFLVQIDNPRLRLWPATSELLWSGGRDLPRLTPTWNKRFLNLEDHEVARCPVPLAAVYLLHGAPDVPDRPAFRALRGQQGLMALVGNSYQGVLLDRQMRAHEFDLLTRLLDKVVIRRLCWPEGGVSPRALCAAIAEDFRRHRRVPGASATGREQPFEGGDCRGAGRQVHQASPAIGDQGRRQGLVMED